MVKFSFGVGKPNIKQLQEKHDVAGLLKVLDSKDEDERNQAREALATIGAPAVDALIDALGSSSWNVRMNSAMALGTIRDVRAVEPLVRGLEQDVKIQAVVALGEIGDKRAEKPLFDVLQDPNDNVRAFAAEALAKMGHMLPSIEALDDTSEFVKRTAIKSLARFSDPRVIDHIGKPLRNAPDWMTRYLAAETLGNLGYENDKMGAKADKTLTQALNDPQQQVREAAQDALKKLRLKRQLDMGDVDERVGAAFELAKKKSEKPKVIDSLIEYYSSYLRVNSEISQWKEASNTWSKMHDKRSLEFVIKLLKLDLVLAGQLLPRYPQLVGPFIAKKKKVISALESISKTL
jgi:HEAT repeat protein